MKLTTTSFPIHVPGRYREFDDTFPLRQIKSFPTSCAELRSLDLSGASLRRCPHDRKVFETTIAKAGGNQLTSLTLPRGYEPTKDGLKAFFRVSPKLEKLKVFIPAANARFWRFSVVPWIENIFQIADGSLLKHLSLDIEMCNERISRPLVNLPVSSSASRTAIVSQLAHLELAVLSYADVEQVLHNFPSLQTLRIRAVYSGRSFWPGMNKGRQWHSVGSRISVGNIRYCFRQLEFYLLSCRQLAEIGAPG